MSPPKRKSRPASKPKRAQRRPAAAGRPTPSDGGWCPRHDRVFEASDGRCPECGTALVPMGSMAHVASTAAPSEEILTPEPPGTADPPDVPERPTRSAWITRGLVAGAVAVAFVLGLLFPRTPAEDRPAPAGKPVSFTADVKATVATSAGVIRLESVAQRGKQLEAHFTVFEGIATPRLLDGAAVEVATVGPGGGRSSFGLADARVISDPTGFTLTGQLEAEDERLASIRITTLAVRLEATPSWDADITSIWPTPRSAEPRVLRVGRTQDVGGGRVTLAAVLGWSDRLEAVFDLEDLEEGEARRYEFGGVQLEVARIDASGTRIGGTTQALGGSVEQRSASQLVATFAAVPAEARKVTMRAVDLELFITGPWTWEIPAR